VRGFPDTQLFTLRGRDKMPSGRHVIRDVEGYAQEIEDLSIK
jgi:hypothetical protein